MSAAPHMLGWAGVVRLGLVQTALGAVVVLPTSTFNRVMQVELGLLALIPAGLVAFQYLVQLSRPHWGHWSDRGGRRTPWILAGMAVLCVGGVLAAWGVYWLERDVLVGMALSIFAYLVIGIGCGAAGTTLLALLAARVPKERRPAAASLVWIMMIVGLAVSAIVAGQLLEPFSMERLMAVSAGVSLIAFVVSVGALHHVERRTTAIAEEAEAAAEKRPFLQAVAEVWRDGDARRFTYFVFIAMLAFKAQDIVLEPFAGELFDFTVRQSTQLSGFMDLGVLSGLLAVAFLGRRVGSLRQWTTAGCLLSAAAFVGLATAAGVGPGWPVVANVVTLGFGNGAFAGAAIASMMALAADGGPGREGVRLGVWGAAQALGFGLAGLLGAFTKDVTLAVNGSEAAAYGAVFGLESALFVAAALLAASVGGSTRTGMDKDTPLVGDLEAAEFAARG